MNSVAVYTVLITILMLIVRTFLKFNDEMDYILKRDISITSITTCVVLIATGLATLKEFENPVTRKFMKLLIGLSTVGLIYFSFYLNNIDVNDLEYKAQLLEIGIWGLGLALIVFAVTRGF